MKKNEETVESCGGITPCNEITELVFIIDRSGSMAGLESDTIGGFNSMIEKQKNLAGECYVSTVLFDGVCETLHDRIKIADVPVMTEKDYVTRGSTALIDALGRAIKHVSDIHRYVRPEDVPHSTMFVITTDGQENSSREYTSDQVKRMIEEKKEKNGWEFLFIGANIDAVETASHYGIAGDRAVNYRADRKGTRVVYDSVDKAVSCFRMGASLRKDWANEIHADYKRRPRGKKDTNNDPDEI